MLQHAQQPQAVPAWPEAAAAARTGLAWSKPRVGPEKIPTKSWVVLQLQQDLSHLLLHSFAAQICPQQNLKSDETPVVSVKAPLQGLQHFTACQVEALRDLPGLSSSAKANCFFLLLACRTPTKRLQHSC